MTRSATANSQDSEWQRFLSEVQDGRHGQFEQHLARFHDIFADRPAEAGPPLVWQPDPEHLTASNIGTFMRDNGFSGYIELHRWSAANRSDFWGKAIQRLGIRFAEPPETILDLSGGVKNPRWLPGALLNCAESCFTAHPDKLAILAGSEDSPYLRGTTYGELEQLVNRFANGLQEHGFQPGDAIALYMPMTVACVAAYLGIIKAGCRVVSIADSFSPDEVQKRVRISGACGMVTVESYRRAGKPVELYEKIRQADAPRAVVIASSGDTLELRNGDLLWDDFLSDRTSFESAVCDPYDVTNILFSSGTTGTPKAIPWTHLTPIKCATDGHFHQDIHPDDVVAWPTNIGWMMGPWLIYATFVNRATMALFEGAPVGTQFINFIREARVTILGVIPSLVRAWRASGLLGPAEWCNIRLFSSTGEPSSREDYLWLMSRTAYRAPVIEYLGGTEIGGGHLTGTVVQPASPATFTTAALGIDFVMLNDAGKPVNEGEEGELFLIPPAIGLSQSLLNKDHEEVYYKNCPTGPNQEILRRHGDQIAKLNQGFYAARGRADDTMNLGGIKVSSRELEMVLESHPAVYEAAAVAVQPGGEGEEKLIVFVVLEQKMAGEELRRQLGKLTAQKLNPLFKIHDLVIADHLPRTASNKLMRRKLRSTYLQSKA